MPHDELIALLDRARTVLDRYLFDADGDAIRDDVAEVCMVIDDALPSRTLLEVRKELERLAQRPAA
ncbi:MAG TPA: hypothetical protein VEU54_03165 [Steroidobacteraceae bacterium]|nr:hypothetical protein [Steroidobacteraceae bacterium]